MPTVVAVMDRGSWESNTDNIVRVDSANKTLLWIPRDLWSDRIRHRVGRAFALGGPSLLIEVLADHGIGADHVLCLRREATEAALADATVVVPVRRRLDFWYPLGPTLRLQDGRKPISFRPPSETLNGERIHQWLGARTVAEPAPGTCARMSRVLARTRRILFRQGPRLPDLARIERQKIFVRELLRAGFDFGRALANPEWVVCTHPAALEDLRAVRADWTFRTLDDVQPRTIDGMQVLVRT